jgi:hypothetical protein
MKFNKILVTTLVVLSSSIANAAVVERTAYNITTKKDVIIKTYSEKDVPLKNTTWKIKRFPLSFQDSKYNSDFINVTAMFGDDGSVDFLDKDGNNIKSFDRLSFSKKKVRGVEYWLFENSSNYGFAMNVISSKPEDHKLKILFDGSVIHDLEIEDLSNQIGEIK